MTTVLPRPRVEVQNADGAMGDATVATTTVTISRDNKGQQYRGVGSTPEAATADVIDKILGDRKTAEWLP